MSEKKPIKATRGRPPLTEMSLFGRAIDVRMRELGETYVGLEQKTLQLVGKSSYINQSLLAKLKTGLRNPRELTVAQLAALCTVLHWTLVDFESALGEKVFPEGPLEAGRFERLAPFARLPIFALEDAAGLLGQSQPLEHRLIALEGLRPDTRLFRNDSRDLEGTLPGLSPDTLLYVDVKMGHKRNGGVYVVQVAGEVVLRRLRELGASWYWLSDSSTDSLRYGEAKVLGEVYRFLQPEVDL